MTAMETTLIALRDGDIPAKVMVGGAPVTKDYAMNTVGADAYAPDAASAANIAVELLHSGQSA